MLYDGHDETLLAFLRDPASQVPAMRRRYAQPSWVSRVLVKLPPLRRFIGRQQVTRLLLDKILRGVQQAQGGLPTTLFEHKTPLNHAALEHYLLVLGRYFAIHHLGVEGAPSSEEGQAWLGGIRRQHLFAKLEYTTNRIAEGLGLRAEHNLAILENEELWLSYYLAEVYVLLEKGVMGAGFSKGELYIYPSSAFSRQLKAYWLCEVLEENGRLSDMHILLNRLGAFQAGQRLPEHLETPLTDHLMDKCVSLHAGYLPPAIAEDPQYHFLREIIRFCLYMELWSLQGHPTMPAAQMLCYVSPATLGLIDSCLQGRAPTLDQPASFAERHGGLYRRGPVKLKYGIKKLLKTLLHRGFIAKLGDAFEGYVLAYLRALKDPRYEVHEGLEPGTNAAVRGYDIDVVLHDKAEDIYYFIQAKSKAFDLPVYLAEQCRMLLDDNLSKGYSRQLQVFKDNLMAPSIRQKLQGRGLQGAHPGNSHFILLHTLPFLNFYATAGVYFYEWNLFRNLLKNGQIQFTRDGYVSQHAMLEKPCFHRPEEMIEAFFKAPHYGAEFEHAYQLFERTYAKFHYHGLGITCKVL